MDVRIVLLRRGANFGARHSSQNFPPPLSSPVVAVWSRDPAVNFVREANRLRPLAVIYVPTASMGFMDDVPSCFQGEAERPAMLFETFAGHEPHADPPFLLQKI